MDRIKIFERNGKQIAYFDLSDIKSNEELSGIVQKAKDALSCLSKLSVYSITDINRIAFDTKTKEVAVDWMAFNKPYVINAALIGATGVRKIMMSAVFKLSNRANVKLFHDFNQAVAWIDSL